MTNAIRAALVGALMLMPLAGTAAPADMAGGDHMAAGDHMATMVCRDAAAGEKATATTTDDKKLVCKSVAGMMKNEPKMKAGMTAKQMDDEWQKFAANVFAVSVYEK